MNNIDIEQYCKFRTAKVWVDKVINCKPVFLMTMYVQAERDGDWHLHMEAVNPTLPTAFMAAGWTWNFVAENVM